jgi:hypothetical protein
MWTSLMFLCFKKAQQACDNCQDFRDTDFTITKKKKKKKKKKFKAG